jgi:hypothetical protein
MAEANPAGTSWQNLLSRLKKTVSGLVLLFCFLLFPAFIVYSSLHHLFELKIGNLRQATLEKMRNQLEHMETYSDNRRYLHLLLKKIHELAQKQNNPEIFLQNNLDNLRKMYPGQIEFIVWDNKGEVIRKLTDQQGLRYILGRLYEVLHEVADAVKTDEQINIATLGSVSRNLNLVRQYLGKIFIPANLRLPYIKNTNAGPILSDFAARFSSFWYQIGDQTSLFCFISESLLKSSSGLHKIAATLNQREKDLICGFTISPEVTSPVTRVPENLAGFLARALAEFENVAEPVFENDQAIVLISLAQPGIRSFCIHPKKANIWLPARNRDIPFTRLMALLIILYAIIHIFIRFKQNFVSIKWKLTGLFLFANLAPLSIMGFISHDYLASKHEAMRNNVKSDQSKVIRDFDNRFASIQHDISTTINNELDKINPHQPTSQPRTA